MKFVASPDYNFIFADDFFTRSLSAKANLLNGGRGPSAFFSWAPLVIVGFPEVYERISAYNKGILHSPF